MSLLLDLQNDDFDFLACDLHRDNLTASYFIVNLAFSFKYQLSIRILVLQMINLLHRMEQNFFKSKSHSIKP